jgi:thiol-disulfide isomerase/thioredoxin
VRAFLVILCLCLAAVNGQAFADSAQPWLAPPPGYAFSAPEACPELARRQTLYRVCDDQMALFSAALADARRDGKLLLVTFGASWCPSCKSLQAELEQPASSASDVSRHFHRVDIALSTLKDGRRVPVSSGEAVLRLVLTSVAGAEPRGVPFMAVLDPADLAHGFARNLDDAEDTTSGGFDSGRLADILAQAERHIRTGAAAPTEPGWLRRKLRRWFAI